ncbi:MAG TPA: protein-methionine-sulfoxide reductase heme-binding subunit MsrQ [Terriglobales bacterium]|nr:protein-methionine-sulfoxide reductase heme-binding subunit MsrQ [Terriglobales bacterium]HXY14065.1 protein-methionine-sulfoxide reductase heme-binding subunit MsrQ [Terriglobales bacterium]
MIRWFKVVVFLACLGPLARLGWKAYNQLLGANPIEVITHATGDWTLIFLLVTLSVTPIRKLTGQLWLIRFRRMFGLFAFFYAVLHFLTYIWLDKFFDIHAMPADIAKRKFITVGFTGFLLLIPLAITSTSGWIRRLGGRRWQRLHQLIYLSATAGVIHYRWLVKKDIHKPLEYAIVLGTLLSYRVIVWSIPKLTAKRPGTIAPPRMEVPQA